MTTHTPPVDILAGITPALEPTFRLDQLVALSPERALYKAWDRSLKRSVALRLHLVPGSPGREWFVRETETLAALDHPAIRHVYALGEVEPFAYRTANWIDGESLADAIRRGARPIPAAMSVVRDLLGALEHAHAHGIIIRRIAPTTLMLDLAGRAIITDLRFSSWCLAHAPAESGFERRLRRALGDDYELLEEIGAGGFGRVYRARDLGLEREVAIKVLHPSLTADLGVVERFRREAQLAARLRHPNIVSIYDIMARAGLTWYAMEFVPGSSLAQVIQRHGTFSLDQTERLLNEALSALEHAHGLGLVHRDIKPENMLIEPDGRLRITDFGLALALRGRARFGGATSRSGTPQFAAPEQLLGERVDQRADLSSVAAVAYFGLLGRPPFSGKTPEQILARQTTDDVPSLAPERRDVPPALRSEERSVVKGC